MIELDRSAVMYINEFVERTQKLVTIFKVPKDNDVLKRIKKQYMSSCGMDDRSDNQELFELTCRAIIKIVWKQSFFMYRKGWQKRVIDKAIGKLHGY